MAPCLFQDDIIHGANDLEKAGVASEKISKVMMEKNLRFNEDKCVVTIGTKTKRGNKDSAENKCNYVWKI